MTREHNNGGAGYKVVTSTAAHAYNFYAFTVLAAVTCTAIVAPTTNPPDGYSSDVAGMASLPLTAGYYPIRGSSARFGTANLVILWLE